MALDNLYLGPLQFHLKARWCQSPGDMDPEVTETLAWWLDRANLMEGVSITPPPHTDASTHGWGGEGGGGYAMTEGLLNRQTGTWSQEEKSLHINALEMRRVDLVLQQITADQFTRTMQWWLLMSTTKVEQYPTFQSV